MEQYIFKQLINLIPTERTAMVKKLAKHYNVSISTIWRYANKMGIVQRAERVDKGTTKIDDATLNHIASLVATSRRKNDKYTFDVKEIIEHLKNDLGIVIDVSYSRIVTLLKDRGLTVAEFKKATPHLQLISEHPNQMHQFDVSICLQWYFDTKKNEFIENETKTKYYSNKIEQTVEKELRGKKKLHRYVLVDHCTGAFFFWYYYAYGENAVDGADFLHKAWSSKKTLISEHLNISNYKGGYLFQGVPKLLYTDNGAILRKIELRNLLQSLKVEIKYHKPGNPRAKGMVEGLMNIIEKGFESYLKIKGIKSIEQLNSHALKWCIDRNARTGFRSQDISRSALWRKIKEEQFLKCPAIEMWSKLLQPNEVTRKVNGNGIIEFNGRKYTVTNTNLINNTIIVKPNAYEHPFVDIHFNGEVYTLEPNKIDEYGRNISKNTVKVGEVKSLKETTTQKFKKKAEGIIADTYGTTFKGSGNKRQMVSPDKSASDPILKTDEKLIVIEPKSKAITVNPHAPITTNKADIKAVRKDDVLMPLSDVIRQYVVEYGVISVEQRDKLTAKYPNGVPLLITATDIYKFLQNKDGNISKLA